MPATGSKLDEPRAHLRFLSTRTFSSLDGLRGLSIIAVIWHHAGPHAGILSRGAQGVDLFFVLSGFLITTLLLREKDHTGRISLRDFYIRRVLRIFPLYYAVLLAYVVLVWLAERHTAPGRQFFANLPWFLTYTANWALPDHPQERIIFYFAWSLAAEEQFYLLWPWVLRLARSALTPVLAAALGVGVAQFSKLGVAHGWLSSGRPGLWMLGNSATAILLGCLAAYLLHLPAGFRLARAAFGRTLSAPLSLGLVAAALTVPSSCLGDLLVHLAMTALVLSCSIQQDHGLRASLGNRVLRYVGTISYGMYLLHMLVMDGVHRMVTDRVVPSFVLALALSIAAATVSYHCFERWFLLQKERFRAATRPGAPRIEERDRIRSCA